MEVSHLLTPFKLRLKADRLAIGRVDAREAFPAWLPPEGFLALIQIDNELTLVCSESIVPREIQAEKGWRALQVDGQLDFSLVGVLAGIIEPLASAGVSVFALSTFTTDLVLVKEELLETAVHVLEKAGYLILYD